MSPTTDLSSKFKRLSEELCAYFEDEGLSIRPSGSGLLPYFHQLNEDSMAEVVKDLNDYLSICKSVLAAGRQLKDKEFFTLKALEYYGFEPNSKLLECLKNPKYIVEFYSLKNTQFFRSLNFFDYITYTIEDIYCRQWIHLYEREEKVAAQIYEIAAKMFTGELKDSYFFQVKHALKERASLERLEMTINSLQIGTLKRDGQVIALSCCVDSEFTINAPPENED
ncbi:hypothetical protein ACES2L_10275 [Bdellovibrio bacteriovorus]